MRGTVDFYGLLGIFSDPLFGAPFRATLVFVYHRLGALLRIGREAFTSRPHWFYTGILRGPKRFSSKTFRFAPNSVHSSGITVVAVPFVATQTLTESRPRSGFTNKR